MISAILDQAGLTAAQQIHNIALNLALRASCSSIQSSRFLANLKIIQAAKLGGASIPGPLLSRLEKAQSPEEVLEIGVEHTSRQAQELLEAGAPGIHLYTLNKSPATRRVMQNLPLVLR